VDTVPGRIEIPDALVAGFREHFMVISEDSPSGTNPLPHRSQAQLNELSPGQPGAMVSSDLRPHEKPVRVNGSHAALILSRNHPLNLLPPILGKNLGETV
jgi:hypothetical protein